MGILLPKRFFQSTLLVFIFALFISTTSAQDQTSPQPSPKPQPGASPSLERRFFKNILHDQKAIWTAPFSTEKSDVKWIAPLTISSAVLFATDRHSAGELLEPGDHHTRLEISNAISHGGSLYSTSAIAGAFYVIGRAEHNNRARETGLLSLEALVNSNLVTSALKAASQRPRPHIDDASGEFFDKGTSFPSGHAANAWSLATVVAHEYGRHRPLVQIAAYGLASAVSLSRYTAEKHFLSDALIGSAIGYGIGRYVYRTRHDPSLDGDDGSNPAKRPQSHLIPLASPIYNRPARAYGIRLAWGL
jgi:hypothetical protein